MTSYPFTAPAGAALLTDWSTTKYLEDDQGDSNKVSNYGWAAADSAPVNARVATTGDETYTIVAGSVTVINGLDIDAVTISLGGSGVDPDVILIKDAPVASGPGTPDSLQPANGLYWPISLAGGNIAVTRCGTMSPTSARPNPSGRIVNVWAGATNINHEFHVTTPNGVAPFIYGTTALQWTKYAHTPVISVPPPLRPARNTIAAVGDSITALGSEAWYQPWMGHVWLNQLHIQSHQRIRYGGGNFSVAGTTIDTQQSVQLPKVLAMNPLPGACVLAVATNDIQSTTYNFGVTVDKLKIMIASLVSVGIAPILWCVPPNDFIWGAGLGATVAQIHARTYQWNAWIRRYAAVNGFALVDAFTALAQADGTAIPGSMEGTILTGHVHPTGYGHRRIARQAIEDGLADIFPPNSLVNTARNTDDISTLFNDGSSLNYGLFTTDTNADGVADGLAGSGTGTHSFSLIAPISSDELRGNWQQSVVSSIGGTSNLIASFTTGWSIGDTIAFSCRVQTSGVEAAGGQYLVALKTDTPGGFTAPDGTMGLVYLWQGIPSWDGDIPDGELYVEFVIPALATDLQLWVSITSVTVATPLTLRVGEVTIRNLTTGGLLI